MIVSIPIWSDYLQFNLDLNLYVLFVSIPIWSDYLSAEYPAEEKQIKMFLFQYGLIIYSANNPLNLAS